MAVYDSWGVYELQYGICGLWEQLSVSVVICVSRLLQELQFVGFAVWRSQCGSCSVQELRIEDDVGCGSCDEWQLHFQQFWRF